MFKKDSAFTYEVDPNFDYILEESGNKYTALRKIKWSGSADYRLDIRKYLSTTEGEQMMKGCSLMSDEGANELVQIMLQNGYGDVDELCEIIKTTRPDIIKKLGITNTVEPFTIEEEEYFDLKGVI